jgi:hypothetical protein
MLAHEGQRTMTAPDGYWSTDHASPNTALSYWIEAICEAFLEMKADAERENFSAEQTKFRFGPIDINYVDTDPQDVWRTRMAIARSRHNFSYLLYMCEGQMGVAQGGRGRHQARRLLAGEQPGTLQIFVAGPKITACR